MTAVEKLKANRKIKLYLIRSINMNIFCADDDEEPREIVSEVYLQ